MMQTGEISLLAPADVLRSQGADPFAWDDDAEAGPSDDAADDPGMQGGDDQIEPAGKRHGNIALPPVVSGEGSAPRPARPVLGQRRSDTIVALALSVALHAGLLLAGIYFAAALFYKPPKLLHSAGGGGAAGVDLVESNAPGDLDAVPPLRAMAEPQPAAATSHKPLPEEKEISPDPFADFPPKLLPEESPEAAPLFGPSIAPSGGPVFKRHRPAADTVAATAPASRPIEAVAAAGPDKAAASGHPAAGAPVSTGPRPIGRAGKGGSGTGSGAGVDGRGIPIPQYPPECLRRREQGTVILRLEVLPDGTVGQVLVVDNAGVPRLAEAAVAAARVAWFEPATYLGRRVTGYVLVPFKFSL